MKIKLILIVFLTAPSLLFSQPRQKEQPVLTRILFLFDASQSMYGQWQTGSKIEIAKKLLSEMVDSLRYIDNVEMALHVYGHLKQYPPQDCDDNRLEVPFEKDNAEKIKRKLSSLQPKGTTPIAASLEACASDFPDLSSRNIIILITDGIEECKGDPCAVSYELQKKGIMLKPFVIGLGINKDYTKTFDCVGTFYNAANEKSFRTVLSIVISQALNSTTAQVNLLDIYGKPSETNVNMTFYDRFSGILRYNFIHTINSRGNPDTLRIDPAYSYRMVVHTIPPVTKDSIRLSPGNHTIIAVDAPQGELLLKYDGVSEYKKLHAIIRKSADNATLHVQEFNTTEKYIVGKYDLEVLSIPRITVKDVKISQSHTTTVQIPQPGMITIITTSPGYGSIYAEEKNTLTWVYNLDENSVSQTLVLQPGSYRVIHRPKNSTESSYTVEKSFKIVSGNSSNISLY